MIRISGYASVVEVDGITRLYGPSTVPGLDYQNLQGNNLMLYRTKADAVNACLGFTRGFESVEWNLYPVRLNIRIAEDDEDLVLLRIQRTLILIEVMDPNSPFLVCRFLGRRTPNGDAVTDKISSLEVNGLSTFSSFNELLEANMEFQRQIGSEAFMASFWHQKV